MLSDLALQWKQAVETSIQPCVVDLALPFPMCSRSSSAVDEDGTSASLLGKTGIDDVVAPAPLRLDHDDPCDREGVAASGF
jgi:hypothetical protein